MKLLGFLTAKGLWLPLLNDAITQPVLKMLANDCCSILLKDFLGLQEPDLYSTWWQPSAVCSNRSNPLLALSEPFDPLLMML